MKPDFDLERSVAAYFGTGGEGAVRETALCLIGSPDERRAIRWLGTALYARALDQPAAPEVDRSLRPSLRAAAKDLAALVGFLQALSPKGEPCDVTLAALAHRCAETLLPVTKALAEAAQDLATEGEGAEEPADEVTPPPSED